MKTYELAKKIKELGNYTIFSHNVRAEDVGKTPQIMEEGIKINRGKGMLSTNICLGQASDITTRHESLLRGFQSDTNVISVVPNMVRHDGDDVQLVRQGLNYANGGENYENRDLLDEVVTQLSHVPAEFVYGTYRVGENDLILDLKLNDRHCSQMSSQERAAFIEALYGEDEIGFDIEKRVQRCTSTQQLSGILDVFRMMKIESYIVDVIEGEIKELESNGTLERETGEQK